MQTNKIGAHLKYLPPTNWHQKLQAKDCTLELFVKELEETRQEQWPQLQQESQEAFFWVNIQYYFNQAPYNANKTIQETKFVEFYLKQHVVSQDVATLLQKPIGSGFNLLGNKSKNYIVFFSANTGLISDIAGMINLLPKSKPSQPTGAMHILFEKPSSSENMMIIPLTYHSASECKHNNSTCSNAATVAHFYYPNSKFWDDNIYVILENMAKVTQSPKFNTRCYGFVLQKHDSRSRPSNFLLGTSYRYCKDSVVKFDQFISNSLVLHSMLNSPIHHAASLVDTGNHFLSELNRAISFSCTNASKPIVKGSYVQNWQEIPQSSAALFARFVFQIIDACIPSPSASSAKPILSIPQNEVSHMEWYNKISHCSLFQLVQELETAGETLWEQMQESMANVFFWLCVQHYLHHVPFDDQTSVAQTKFVSFYLSKYKDANRYSILATKPIGSGLHFHPAKHFFVFVNSESAQVSKAIDAFALLPRSKQDVKTGTHYIFDAPWRGSNSAIFPFVCHPASECSNPSTCCATTELPQAHFYASIDEEALFSTTNLKPWCYSIYQFTKNQNQNSTIDVPKIPPNSSVVLRSSLWNMKLNAQYFDVLDKFVYMFETGSNVAIATYLNNSLMLHALFNAPLHQVYSLLPMEQNYYHRVLQVFSKLIQGAIITSTNEHSRHSANSMVLWIMSAMDGKEAWWPTMESIEARNTQKFQTTTVCDGEHDKEEPDDSDYNKMDTEREKKRARKHK